MDLPTSRELELEVSLRQRDVQVAELSDEITRLRQYLATQPGPSATDPVALPPSFLSILLPQLEKASKTVAPSKSSTVTAALTQKVKALQEENDELYHLLKYTETSKLKEEVELLRMTVISLEEALHHSDQIISGLSQDLVKSREAFASLRLGVYSEHSTSTSDPRSQIHTSGNGVARPFSKPPPTGPKGHKRPRLSDAQPYPAVPRGNSSAPPSQKHYRKHESRGRSPRPRADARGSHRSASRMDTDEDSRRHPRSSMAPSRDDDRDLDDRERSSRNRADEKDTEEVRERPRDKDKDIDRDRDRARDSHREKGVRELERERERSKPPKRNGNFNRPGGKGGTVSPPPRKSDRSSYRHSHVGDRTLKERMGL